MPIRRNLSFCNLSNIAVIILIFIVNIDSVPAVDIEQKFYLPVEYLYESNPSLLIDGEQAVYKTVTTPKYSFQASSETSIWRTDIAYHIERSSDETLSSDREDPSANINWKNIFENSELLIDLYAEQRSTRETELEDTGEIFTDGTRQLEKASLGWRHYINNYVSYAIDVSSSNTTYENISLVDYSVLDYRAKLIYKKSDRLELYIAPGASVSKQRETEIENEINFINVGSDWESGENSLLKLKIGSARNKQQKDMPSITQGSIEYAYLSENNTTSLSYERLVVPSGIGGYVVADQLFLNMSMAIDDRNNIKAMIGARKNPDINNVETTFSSIIYGYELTEKWMLNLGASYRQVNINDQVSRNQTVFISTNYTFETIK